MIGLDIAFYFFIFVVCVQVVFYGGIFSRVFRFKNEDHKPKNIAISVLICAKNEAENINRFLPLILSQDYPNFEVVLINDNSKDDTLHVMERFRSENNNVKIVDVKGNETFWGNKKYALTLGIKAASHDFLLFTDADCKPVSEHWISEMSSRFTNTRSIVLGYSPYKKIKGSVLNKIIRFETFLTGIQYMSWTILGQPYMGVGRNLAYRKSLFFESNGFMDHMQIKSGDDDLFVNKAAVKENTAISLTPKSFVESLPCENLRSWVLQKRRHITTAKHYKGKHKTMLSLFYLSQISFFVLAIILLALSFKVNYVLIMLGLRYVTVLTVVFLSAKTLNEKDLPLWTPFLELFLVAFQFFIFMQNLISKPKYWK